MPSDVAETFHPNALAMSHDPRLPAPKRSPLVVTAADAWFLMVPLLYALMHVALAVAYTHNVFGPNGLWLLTGLSVLSTVGAVVFGVLAAGRAVTLHTSKTRRLTVAIALFHAITYAGLVVFNLMFFHTASVTI
ncbi:MAG: hypothetical protein GC159_08925 [Phycisphaera sp.]|nr:hypothetical protein [Phycisphaera sp.]